MASYNEESGRYKKLEPVFYVPGPERKLVQIGKAGAYEFVDGTVEQFNLVCHPMILLEVTGSQAWRELMVTSHMTWILMVAPTLDRRPLRTWTRP
jgi:thymidylate synthase (FAD)